MIIIFVIVFFIVVVNLIVSHSRQSSKNASTFKSVPLLTPAEFRFYLSLRVYTGSRAIIFSKVRLADLFESTEFKRSSSWFSDFNRLALKHCDFVLVSSSGGILCGVELDDSSHVAVQRRERDLFFNSVFESARVPLFRFAVKSVYSSTDFKMLDNVFKSLL